MQLSVLREVCDTEGIEYVPSDLLINFPSPERNIALILSVDWGCGSGCCEREVQCLFLDVILTFLPSLYFFILNYNSRN